MYYLFLLLVLSSCASVDRNVSASAHNFLRTRIDFSPLDRAQREQLFAVEKKTLDAKLAELRLELEAAKAARQKKYEQIKGEFADCQNQKHCLSNLARGNVQQFERYNALTKSLHEDEIRIVGVESNILDWQKRYDLRTRAIQNRYLVHELLDISREHPEFQSVSVHSLESFETRKELSRRLIRFSDVDIPLMTWGDLDFQMLKRPVDEAAVVAAFEVAVKAENSIDRYLVTFLVNSYQTDTLAYDKGFFRAWATVLGERGQAKLQDKVFCSIYSIASETLAPRLGSLKGSSCAAERTRVQKLSVENFSDRFAPEDWLLPVSFFRIAKEN